VFVDVCYAAIVLLLKGIVGGIGVGVSALPKLLDKLLALFVSCEMKECATLFRGYDVDDVLVQPFLVLGI
jgi:hypothetical protein